MKKKRGNSLGFKIFDLYLSLGIRHAYALLYFVAFHYLLFDRKAVRTTGEYVDIRFKKPAFFPRIKHIYKLFVNAGKNLIDLRQLERNSYEIKMECETTRIMELIAEGNGLFLFTAHTGNWQIMMRNLPALGVKINIVMLPEENPAVREYLQIDKGERHAINIIDPSEGADAVLKIMQELSSGNIVSVMGDRIPRNSKTFSVEFFENNTELPEGPFLIAATSKSPVLFLLTRRNGPCNYTLEVNELKITDNIKDKKDKIRILGEKYINTLEDFLQHHPYEWSPAGKI